MGVVKEFSVKRAKSRRTNRFRSPAAAVAMPLVDFKRTNL